MVFRVIRGAQLGYVSNTVSLPNNCNLTSVSD